MIRATVSNVLQLSNIGFKLTNTLYSTTDNECELEINCDTIIKKINLEDGEKLNISVKSIFTQFNDNDDVAIDKAINVIGIVKNVTGPKEMIAKDGRLLIKNTVTPMDGMRNKIVVTSWGTIAESLKVSVNDVVSMKGAGIRVYDGVRLLKLYSFTVVIVGEDVEEAHRLKEVLDGMSKKC
ncbi:hypothetical protein TKK_0013811 [Trichogramma kaykai]